MTNRQSLHRIAALFGLVCLALVLAAPLHLEEGNEGGDHCAVCHLRHVSAIGSTATPAATAPDRLEVLRVPSVSGGESESCFALHPSRGPPA